VKAQAFSWAPMTLLFLLSLSPAVGAQGVSLPPSVEERLATEPLVSSFQFNPRGLRLLPQFSGSPEFAARHGALRAHAVQEALFALKPLSVRMDRYTAYRILLQAPTLSNLTFRSAGESPVTVFGRVRFIAEPQGDDLHCVVEIHDNDFGTARFEGKFINTENRFELRMVNLDSLHYLIFPAVPPRHALVDLLYFDDPQRPLVYTAWSVRAYFFVPGVVDIEKLLYHRAMALKDWFTDVLERTAE